MLLASASLLCACKPEQEAAASDTLSMELRRRDATRVRTSPVVQQEMVRSLSTTTTVESARQIEIFPRVAGVVDVVHVEEGAQVTAGEALATLDRREAVSRHADATLALEDATNQIGRLDVSARESQERSKSAELTFEQSKSEYQRNLKAGLISELDLQKLKLTRDTNERTWKALLLTQEGSVLDRNKQDLVIERAKLTLLQEELALSFTQVTAPFDGVVAMRNVRVGDTVTSGSPAFVLTDPAHLRCIVPRPQRELVFFRAAHLRENGVEIRVVPEAYPDQEYLGEIEIISPTIDTESGSFRLTVGLKQPEDGRPLLLPGMLVRLSIVTERHPEALTVPKRALRREGDRYFIYLDSGGKARRVEVTEGFSDDEFVEITPIGEGALSPGDRVVVVGNRDLEDGEPIENEASTSPSDETLPPTEGE